MSVCLSHNGVGSRGGGVQRHLAAGTSLSVAHLSLSLSSVSLFLCRALTKSQSPLTHIQRRRAMRRCRATVSSGSEYGSSSLFFDPPRSPPSKSL
ncbi:unnamed protein product [Camellia sinensis]